MVFKSLSDNVVGIGVRAKIIASEIGLGLVQRLCIEKANRQHASNDRISHLFDLDFAPSI